MRIRSLVPALACLAAAPFTTAADGVTLDGFVDTRMSVGTTKQEPAAPPAGGPELGFSYFARIGADFQTSDKVGGKIDVINSSYTSNGVELAQAYGRVTIDTSNTLKTGLIIAPIGFSGPFATDWWRPTAGAISRLYGGLSHVGAELTHKVSDDVKVVAAITNGFFGEGTGARNQGGEQGDYALAYTVDVAMKVNPTTNIDFELVYDMDAAASVSSASFTGAPQARGGNGLHLGVNAEMAPTDGVKVALELIYQSIMPGKDLKDSASAVNNKRLGFMAMANYVVPGCPWHSNITGSFQIVQSDAVAFVTDNDAKVTELAVAMNSSPFGGNKFAVNAELAYMKVSNKGALTPESEKTTTITLEALYRFP